VLTYNVEAAAEEMGTAYLIRPNTNWGRPQLSDNMVCIHGAKNVKQSILSYYSIRQHIIWNKAELLSSTPKLRFR